MLPLPSMAMAAAGHRISPTQGLHQDLAAGRPIPASLSNCRDNCHKSNCSCWITSILHHHPQLPRASSELLFQGWKAAPLSQERPNQAGSGHLKQSPHAEGPLTTVCQALTVAAQSVMSCVCSGGIPGFGQCHCSQQGLLQPPHAVPSGRPAPCCRDTRPAGPQQESLCPPTRWVG